MSIRVDIYLPKLEERGVVIDEGEYSLNEVVDLLRAHKRDPETIQWLADMLEE